MAVDKSTFPPGPWQAESDHEDWIDDSTGLACHINRCGGSGHLCGYVGLPEGHHLFGVKYGDINVNVHGGLTYSAQEGDLWVIGFDCAHSGDYTPGYAWASEHSRRKSYKTFEYVKAEIESLLQQVYSPMELLASTAERKKKV